MKPQLGASSLREQLSGTDRRSIGRVPTVVRDVLKDPTLMPALIDALADIHAVVRMRAADALEKVTAARPDLLRRWTTRLLRLAVSTDQQEVRWHLAQMMPRLRLTRRRRAECVQVLRRYMNDRSSIVRTLALQALVDLSEGDPRLRSRVDPMLAETLRTGTPAMRARARRILARRAKNDARKNARQPQTARGGAGHASTPKK